MAQSMSDKNLVDAAVQLQQLKQDQVTSEAALTDWVKEIGGYEHREAVGAIETVLTAIDRLYWKKFVRLLKARRVTTDIENRLRLLDALEQTTGGGEII